MERLWETNPKLYAERQARFLTSKLEAAKIDQLVESCQSLNQTITKLKERLRYYGEAVDDQAYLISLG